MAIRRPAVAGAFYAASPEKLRKQIIDSFQHRLGPGRLPDTKSNRDILAIMSPHAGYVYSGPSAAHAYLALGEQEAPETVVVVGPNHTGWGTPVSIMDEGKWETPLGDIPIDSELARDIIELSPTSRSDESAFIREHSIEVQLPFLQFIYPSFKLVPICMGIQDLDVSRELGEALFEATRDKDVLVVASSDLNHQESKTVSDKKNKHVLDSIKTLDEQSLHQSVQKYDITTCGYGPMSVSMVYSKLNGASSGEVLSYYTSGDITGDNRTVVGYASAKITRN